MMIHKTFHCFVIAFVILCTACHPTTIADQPSTVLPTCADLGTGAVKAIHLLFQRTDQSIWLVPLPTDTNPSLADACRRQLTESLTGENDILNWSLSPDQQWVAYLQLKGWRVEGHYDRGRLTLLNLWTGEKRQILDVLLPEKYNWMEEPWDMDRALFESEPLWSQDSQQVILVSAHTGQVGLYRYALPTNTLTLLVQGPHNLAWPQWSPDEQYLLYNDISAFGTGAGPTGGALWAVRSDGTAPPHRLSQTDDHYERVSTWLDQTHVTTYKTDLGHPLWDASTVDLQTGTRTPTFIQEPATLPCWRYDFNTNELTMKLQLPTNDWVYCNAALSPNGHFAIADNDGSVESPISKFLLLDLQTGAVTTLAERTFPESAVFNPTWSPAGDILLWLTPMGNSTSAGNDNYGLWGVRVEQKQPFLIAERVELWPKWEWITHHP